MGFLFPRDCLGQELDDVAHAVDSEADFRILAQSLHIPAARFLDDAAANHIIGARDRTQLEEKETPRLVHALMGQCLDVDKPGQDGGIAVPGPEFPDHGT